MLYLFQWYFLFNFIQQGPLSHLIDNFFIQPTHQRRPIATIINKIGNKLSNTADSVIGMFRSTVEIIVG